MDAPPRSEFTRAAIGVVALCFVLNTLARGNGETFAVFYGPLLEDMGWGRADTASLYSAFMIALGFSGPLIGALFDRYGPRLVYTCGLLAYGAGFLIARSWRRSGMAGWAWGCLRALAPLQPA